MQSQDHSISRFKGKGKGIHGHIRTRLKNDSDHTHGNTHLTDHKTIGPTFHGKDLPDGIVQCSYLTHPFRNPLYTSLGQAQTIHQSRRHTVFLSVLQIDLIALQNFSGVGHKGICDTQQRVIFFF